jgi:hypothetical protein
LKLSKKNIRIYDPFTHLIWAYVEEVHPMISVLAPFWGKEYFAGRFDIIGRSLKVRHSARSSPTDRYFLIGNR